MTTIRVSEIAYYKWRTQAFRAYSAIKVENEVSSRVSLFSQHHKTNLTLYTYQCTLQRVTNARDIKLQRASLCRSFCSFCCDERWTVSRYTKSVGASDIYHRRAALSLHLSRLASFSVHYLWALIAPSIVSSSLSRKRCFSSFLNQSVSLLSSHCYSLLYLLSPIVPFCLF